MARPMLSRITMQMRTVLGTWEQWREAEFPWPLKHPPPKTQQGWTEEQELLKEPS